MKWLFVLCLPVLLLTASIGIAFNSLWLYEYGFEKYGVSRATGISPLQLEHTARELINYFNSGEEYIDVTVVKDGQPIQLFNREERIFTVFGILAGVWTAFTVALTVYLWQSDVAAMVQDLLSGRDLLSLLLIGGLVILSGATLILGLIIKALLLASEGAARLRKLAQTRRARRS